MLPPVSPVNINTFNYAPLAVVVVIALATILWFASGKKNFMSNAEAEHLTMDASKLLG